MLALFIHAGLGKRKRRFDESMTAVLLDAPVKGESLRDMQVALMRSSSGGV